jgi:chlorophyllide a reductase subunit Y
VPTASGVPLRLLPEEINGVRIVGIDVPGFGVPTHAEAKDVLAGAMLNYARRRPSRARSGPCAGSHRPPTVTLLGEMFPADPVGIGMGCSRPGAGRRSGRADARMARALCRARLRRRGRDPPLLHRAIREFEAAGRPIVGSAPVGHDGTAAWLEAIGEPANVPPTRSPRRKNAFLPAIKGALAAAPIKGTITLSGYEGSELLVARLLIESGAECALCRHRLPQDALVRAGCEWLEARGVKVQFRASLEQDIAAMEAIRPTSPSARRRWCRRQRAGHPGALLHQPHLGPPADGSRRGRLAGAGGQRGHGQQGPLRSHEGLLRGRRRPATPPASGKARRTCEPDFPRDEPQEAGKGRKGPHRRRMGA